MSALEWAMLLFTIASLATGQILFKYSALATQHETALTRGLVALLSNPYFFLALFVYGVSTLAWVWLLRTVELNYAYPFVALCFVIVPIISHFVFGESLNFKLFAGCALIVAGIIVINFNFGKAG